MKLFYYCTIREKWQIKYIKTVGSIFLHDEIYMYTCKYAIELIIDTFFLQMHNAILRHIQYHFDKMFISNIFLLYMI